MKMSKERVNAQLNITPCNGIKFPSGTVLKTIDVTEHNDNNGQPADYITLEDLDGKLYSMSIRSFLSLRGDNVTKPQEGEVRLADLITIVSSEDRVSSGGITMYPNFAYKGFDEFCNSAQSYDDYKDLLNSGLFDGNTLEPKQYYTVETKYI